VVERDFFTADTLIADAIKRDPGVVDRLIAYNPIFRRLKNPVLRRVMTRLVRFGEAARVAGVPLAEMLAVANDLPLPVKAPTEAEDFGPPPAWIKRAEREANASIDARALLEAGEEPLGPAMRAAAGVPEGGFLLIDAPFDPAPLRRVLAGKGFTIWPRKLADDHWRIYCRRGRGSTSSEASEAPDTEANTWTEDNAIHIDVRGLEPPQPMLNILALLERVGADSEIIVHHEREPLFLYPELAERGWSHEIVTAPAGEIRLRLRRDRS